MIHRIQTDDDLAQFTGEPPTHLWRTASMSTWHLAVPFREGHGVNSPCGAGGVQTPGTLRWRGGMVVALADIEEKGVVWQSVCVRCETILRGREDA